MPRKWLNFEFSLFLTLISFYKESPMLDPYSVLFTNVYVKGFGVGGFVSLFVNDRVVVSLGQSNVHNDCEVDDDACPKHVAEELKEEVRRMLRVDANFDPSNKLNLIDSLQRLGVTYHFEGEIEELLDQIKDTHLIQNAKTDIIRRTANYHPSIWGDQFLKYAPDVMVDEDGCPEHVVEELKEEVRRMLRADANFDPSNKLNLIDSLQRLGVAYHFEGEIEELLEQMKDTVPPDHGNHLYTIALWFRLLRQQGYNVSCNVFNRFKDSKAGSFKEDLLKDVSGLLCLYEATHLRVHGEDILDKALAFTTTELKSMLTHHHHDLKPPLTTQVMHALKQPLHKGMPRLETRLYISFYEEMETKNETLLKLAKLDFNSLQLIHRQELSQLSRWWKELDFATKLPYARDRLVECYFWIVGVYFEPNYSLARMMLTKVIAMTSIIDDTYDVYGTLEELNLFTDAIERWDIRAMDQLPEYMKVLYSALLDVYNEIEEELRKEGQFYRLNYALEAMKRVVRAYFIEAKWFNGGCIPTFEEYMRTALTSCAYPMLTITSFLGMRDIIETKEALDWAIDDPKLVRASSVICRLMDDIVSHKMEQERGHVCSSVECYMKQHSVTEQAAYDELQRRVDKAWKDINQGCIKPTTVPMPFLLRILNFTRMMDVMYKHKDEYTNASKVLKEYITVLFIDPILLYVNGKC
ncbi:(-)-germacrene D synthase-like [Telopea speciosissima]|uniref:(-)-germacrene D synthase-like n=1 Tax=Telopea speciosissima TaxID=54955 RepID=UPI001CC64EF1|nr:(-)-germacrene D synthase-like [Telopea speciosissima]